MKKFKIGDIVYCPYCDVIGIVEDFDDSSKRQFVEVEFPSFGAILIDVKLWVRVGEI
jgi:hypothetical protein